MALSPHLNPDAGVAGVDLDRPVAQTAGGLSGERIWRPRRVLITKSALSWDHGRAMAERCAALGLPIIELHGDRLSLSDQSYAEAKSTLAIVVAPPGKLKLQPIQPSADWRVDLAEGCPAHCSYCYLAGSLKGPPITRAYANLPEILRGLPDFVGKGRVTSTSAKRAHEGTTFEASCYTDPLGIEHLTGSLAAMVAHFGAWHEDVQLRFTTKFDAVGPLLSIDHQRRTRMRVSLNPAAFAKFEGGTAKTVARIAAMRRVAAAGYLVGLTIAPIIAAPGWRDAYAGLLRDVADALDGVPDPDLTVEVITHRYSPTSKAVLDSWYPGSSLDMSATDRTEKRTKFGSVKHVYDRPTMTALRSWFEDALAAALPRARLLYWT